MKTKKPLEPLSESQHLGYARDNGDGTVTYFQNKPNEPDSVACNITAADVLFGIFGMHRVKSFTKCNHF